MSEWIGVRSMAEVMAGFERVEAAVAPVYDIRDVFADPQYQALDNITSVADEEVGPIRMQNVLYRLSQTPGSIRWAGRPHGADTDQVLGSWLGLDDLDLARLRAAGAI